MPGSITVTASPGDVNNGNKTDAAGDDIAEYIAGSRTVRVRIGTGATATAGRHARAQRHRDVHVPGDARPAVGRHDVDNNATLAYRARTIAKDFTFTGNVVATPVRAARRPRR